MYLYIYEKRLQDDITLSQWMTVNPGCNDQFYMSFTPKSHQVDGASVCAVEDEFEVFFEPAKKTKKGEVEP